MFFTKKQTSTNANEYDLQLKQLANVCAICTARMHSAVKVLKNLERMQNKAEYAKQRIEEVNAELLEAAEDYRMRVWHM